MVNYCPVQMLLGWCHQTTIDCFLSEVFPNCLRLRKRADECWRDCCCPSTARSNEPNRGTKFCEREKRKKVVIHQYMLFLYVQGPILFLLGDIFWRILPRPKECKSAAEGSGWGIGKDAAQKKNFAYFRMNSHMRPFYKWCVYSWIRHGMLLLLPDNSFPRLYVLVGAINSIHEYYFIMLLLQKV